MGQRANIVADLRAKGMEYEPELMQDRKVIAQLAKNHQEGATEEEFSLTKLLANFCNQIFIFQQYW